MDIINELKQYLGLVVIDPERDYWFVRTKGGSFFNEFYKNGFIAIGWNIIDGNDIDQISDEDEFRESIKEKIRDHNEEEKRPGYVAGQILRFATKIKKGDIILVPSHGSQVIAFGEIADNHLYIEDIDDAVTKERIFDDSNIRDSYDNNEECPYSKRRKVKWIKKVNNDKLDPYLYRIIYAHNTVTNATKEYGKYIDRMLYDYYLKDGVGHLIIDVNQTEDIKATDLIKSINTIISSIDLYNNTFNTDYNKEDIDIKLNVQSPGAIEFFTSNIGAFAILGGLLSLLVIGGKISFSFKPQEQSGSISSEGFIEKLIKLKQQKHDNKMEEKRFEKEKNMDMLKYEKELMEIKLNLKLKLPNEGIENNKEKNNREN